MGRGHTRSVPSCGRRTEINQLEFACPICESGEITIEGGRDLFLETIELEEEP
jgi:Zn finger protein HypA/HybF involved in hydrogenase expression